MSVDLKDKEIAVCPITPGFAITEFGPGAAALESMGAKVGYVLGWLAGWLVGW